MSRLNPWIVRRYLIPASYLIFLAGLMASAAFFYRGRPFDPRIAHLGAGVDRQQSAWLLGIGRRDRDFRNSVDSGGSRLLPALRKDRPALALGGAVIFGAGLPAAVAIGILAPFTHGYSPLHIQLAYVAFIGIAGGTVLHLIAARASPFLIVPQVGVVLFLIYLYFGPKFSGQEFFNEDHFVTRLTFWEWLLCVDCGVALWALSHVVVKLDQAATQPFALAAKSQA
jgi:hypothetical protein